MSVPGFCSAGVRLLLNVVRCGGLVLIGACGSTPQASGDGGGADLTGTDAPRLDSATADQNTHDSMEFDRTEPSVDAAVPPIDAGPLPDFPSDWARGRGWDWVRANQPFVSALSVRMGEAPAPDVNRYFDDFHATAAHLWASGLPNSAPSWTRARPGIRWMTWLDSAGRSTVNNMLLGGVEPPPGLIAYQIGDEPRDRSQFARTLAGFAAVAEADPEPLRVFNFTYQASEVETYLRESCESGHVDVFSYDRYSFGNDQFTSMMLFRDAAIACGIPYWRYLKSYVDARDGSIRQTESDLRWDAFSGLLAGYTGHTWFLYNVRGGVHEGIPTTFFDDAENWGAAPTPRFAVAAQINQEMVAYGRAQTRLRSTGVGWVTENEIAGQHPPQGFPAWRAGGGNDPFLTSVRARGNELPVLGSYQDLLLGFFDDRFGDHYVIAMNPNHTHGRLPTDTETDAEVTMVFDFAGSPDVSTEALLVLRPTGRVESLPLADRTASFTLAPGDVIFFKYDTGRGFEGYR